MLSTLYLSWNALSSAQVALGLLVKGFLQALEKVSIDDRLDDLISVLVLQHAAVWPGPYHLAGYVHLDSGTLGLHKCEVSRHHEHVFHSTL